MGRSPTLRSRAQASANNKDSHGNASTPGANSLASGGFAGLAVALHNSGDSGEQVADADLPVGLHEGEDTEWAGFNNDGEQSDDEQSRRVLRRSKRLGQPASDGDDGGVDADESDDAAEKRYLATTAEIGRQYKSWFDPYGKTITTTGALLPTNYACLGDEKLPPWVCPVRDCRKCFGTLPALGGHFSAAHNAGLYNDNLDGTLTKVGERTAKNRDGRCPAAIVSAHTLSGVPAPIATPTRGRGPRKRRSRQPRGQRTPSDGGESGNDLEAEHADEDNSGHRGEGPAANDEAVSAPNEGSTVTSDGDRPEHGYYDILGHVSLFAPAEKVPSGPKEKKILDYLRSLPRLRDVSEDWVESLAGYPLTGFEMAVSLLVSVTGTETDCANCAGNNQLPYATANCAVLQASPPPPAELADLLQGDCSVCFLLPSHPPCDAGKPPSSSGKGCRLTRSALAQGAQGDEDDDEGHRAKRRKLHKGKGRARA